MSKDQPNMKFDENNFLSDTFEYIKATYGEHYVGDENDEDKLQLVEFWNMMGSDESTITTCRDVAAKYLARYGRKEGRNKKDLFKAVHYIAFMAFYTDRETKKK